MTSLLDELRPNDGETQRRMAKAILYMLHRVRKPYELARAPFADALCRATGISNPSAALHYVVEDTLRGDDARTARLRGVLELDFSDDEKFGEAAVRMHISRRHLQRFRAEAVAAVAYHVGKLLGARCEDDGAVDSMTADSLENLADLAAKVEPSTAATIHQLTGAGVSESLQLIRLRAAVEQGSPIGEEAFANHPGLPRAVVAQFVAFSNEMNGKAPGNPEPLAAAGTRYGPTVRFELEYLAFLRARQRGFALEMNMIAASLRRLAGERGGALPVALQCQADASLRAGDVTGAQVNLDFAGRLTFSRSDLRQFAAATMLQSKISLYEDQTHRAEDLANGAYAVLNRNHRDAYACAVLVSQARWRRGASWRPSFDAGRLPEASWDRLAIDIEHARHLAREGRSGRAERLAWRVHRIASAAGFEGLSAAAAGVLYAVALAQSRFDYARQWRADAIARLLRTQDRLLGIGLLATAQPALDSDDLLIDEMHRRLCVFVPQMLSDDARQRTAVCALLAQCLDVLHDARPVTSIADAVELVGSHDSALCHYAGQAAAGVAEILVLTGAALAGKASEQARARAVQIAEILFEMNRPSQARSFAIAT